jgi:NAD(P)-dependent dehydrogenase (short-subunit alcohol dehydrogenase family)
MVRRTLLRRAGEPQDIAGPVVFLASQQARYVTGTILPVDGGYTAN